MKAAAAGASLAAGGRSRNNEPAQAAQAQPIYANQASRRTWFVWMFSNSSKGIASAEHRKRTLRRGAGRCGARRGGQPGGRGTARESAGAAGLQGQQVKSAKSKTAQGC